MTDTLLLLLVFAAVASGWVLGRWQRPSRQVQEDSSLPRQYYQGLNYLLNEQPDVAIDSFIEALEVNSETLETHIAIGNLMRRKGEVERAIRIHQNLLARPSLPRLHVTQAHLELAKDFISAGLFDRAERLLLDLIIEAPEKADVALRLLMDIYQHEREWQKAIAIGRRLLPKRSLLKLTQAADKNILVPLAHFCCELAELAIARNDFQEARSQLREAVSFDQNCIRASLLMAQVEYETGNYHKAIRALQRVPEQNRDFVPETLAPLKRCYEKLGQLKAYHQYLHESLERHFSTALLLTIAEGIQSREGDEAAAQFIGEQLKDRPSLKGLAKLVELHIKSSTGSSRENLTILQLLIEQLLQDKPQYQCQHCGFSGKQLHWLCPSCKQWGTMKSIHGVEGEQGSTKKPVNS